MNLGGHMDRPAENQILATPTVSRPPARSRRAVRQLRIGHQAIGSSAVGAQVSGSFAMGAVALGAIAVGALALGALAIGRLVIGRASVREAHLQAVTIDDLKVVRLFVRDLRIEKGAPEPGG
jgi:hypothetical protein